MLPKGLPAKTLGWQVLDWCSRNLAQPDGINKGNLWEFTNDQALFILWFYALDEETGRWIYRRAYRERAKGVGKTPMVAAMACAELLGPVFFNGWDKNGDPIGIPHPSPLVQLAAVSESQADQTMVLIASMLANGRAADNYNLDIALSRVYDPSRGKLEKVTASPRSREGARPSFVVMEETHNWVPAEKGPEFAEVLRRNLVKSGGRSVEVTNAPLPGENSVAEATHFENMRLQDLGLNKGVLFDTESIHVDDVKDREQAIPALKWIYRNSPWVDVENIFEEISGTTYRESNARKYFFNEIVLGESGWIKKSQWLELEKPKPLKKTDKIAVGFAGNQQHGAAFVAVRLKDNAVFLLKKWEKPDGADRGWETPFAKVDDYMRTVLKRNDVALAYCSPRNWQDIIGRWSIDYEDTVEEFWTSEKLKMCKAVEQFESAVLSGRMKVADDPELTRHITACHIDEVPQGVLIRKETPNSSRYIFAAQAAVLAFAAATEAIANGALKEKDNYIWSF